MNQIDRFNKVLCGVISAKSLPDFAIEEIYTNGVDNVYMYEIDKFHQWMLKTIEMDNWPRRMETKMLLRSIGGEDAVDAFLDQAMSIKDDFGALNFIGSLLARFYKGKNEDYTYFREGYDIEMIKDKIFVFYSPYVTTCQMAPVKSIEVGDLDNADDIQPDVVAYCLGPEWFDESNQIPYKVYSASTEEFGNAFDLVKKAAQMNYQYACPVCGNQNGLIATTYIAVGFDVNLARITEPSFTDDKIAVSNDDFVSCGSCGWEGKVAELETRQNQNTALK